MEFEKAVVIRIKMDEEDVIVTSQGCGSANWKESGCDHGNHK